MGLGTEENNKKLQLFEQKWQQKWQHRQVPENCLLVMALEAEALELVGYASVVLEMQRRVNSEPNKAEPIDVAPKVIAPKFIAPKDVAPKDVAPKDVVPIDVAPKDVAPIDVAPIDVAPIEPLMRWLLRCYK